MSRVFLRAWLSTGDKDGIRIFYLEKSRGQSMNEMVHEMAIEPIYGLRT